MLAHVGGPRQLVFGGVLSPAGSAHKDGIADADITHALDHAIWRGLQLYDDEERVIIIGPDRNGELLELVVRPALAPSTVIHADRARDKFLKHLR